MNSSQDPLNAFQKIILVILSFVFPPVVLVLLEQKILCREVALAVILMLLGHLPGTIFALFYLFFEYPRRQEIRSLYQRLDEVEGGMSQAVGQLDTSVVPEQVTLETYEAPQQPSSSQQLESTLYNGDSGMAPPGYSAVEPSSIDAKDNKHQF